MNLRNYYIPIVLGLFAIAVFVFFTYKKTDSNQTFEFKETGSSLQDQAPSGDNLGDKLNPEALLPDLQVKNLTDAHIITGSNGSRTLRFPGTFMNTGDGPLELVGTPDTINNTTRAIQQIYKKDGTKEEKFVGNFVFHKTHDHWHFEDFVEFELLGRLGDGEFDQRLLGTGKMTFCLHDYAPLPEDFSGKPDQIVYPWCNPKSAGIQGISVGWVDTYLADVPGQELDITSLPDGIYAFRSVVDPGNLIAEKDENNNISITYIELSGSNIHLLPSPPN